VRIINPFVQQEMGLGLDTNGIVIVEPGPNGSSLGFRAGDIIEEINGVTIISAEQIDELVGSSSSRSGQFIISRNGQRLIIRYRL
jgi:type II secretory pathway component PulC